MAHPAAGPARPRPVVFFCSMGGFDTHTSQDGTYTGLLNELSGALSAFYDATVEVGLSQQITAFTQSEFGRTLQPNGSGSDHAWGGHQLVVGGPCAAASTAEHFGAGARRSR
ncbi:MAG: DUF1501 domain-containing protein [Vicinamibacterales bacterium]